MARLSKTERSQLQQIGQTRPQPNRWTRSSPEAYLAFATFAARFAPPTKRKPITGGTHWKL